MRAFWRVRGLAANAADVLPRLGGSPGDLEAVLAKLTPEQKQAFSALERLTAPDLLPFAELKKADKELGAVYGRVMKLGSDWTYGSVTIESIRETQRLWIPYRDAWATFGVLARPGSTADAWKTWATRERIKLLEAMLAL